MAADSRQIIAGVSGSLRSLGALRAAADEARSARAELLAVLAWAPAGGEIAYMRAPCPLLLRLWEQVAAGDHRPGLAGIQMLLALWIYRKLPLAGSPPRPVPVAHRMTGFAVFAPTIPVAVHCLIA